MRRIRLIHQLLSDVQVRLLEERTSVVVFKIYLLHLSQGARADVD